MSVKIKPLLSRIELSRYYWLFYNPSRSIENLPPSNIVNYDETNLTDDPGQAKVVCKKRTKYVNRILDSSKSSTSVMLVFAALVNVWHHMLSTRHPTYTPHRQKLAPMMLSTTGLKEAGYIRRLVWEDRTALFQEMGVQLIGDHLCSHLSIRELELCEQNNIRLFATQCNIFTPTIRCCPFCSIQETLPENFDGVETEKWRGADEIRGSKLADETFWWGRG